MSRLRRQRLCHPHFWPCNRMRRMRRFRREKIRSIRRPERPFAPRHPIHPWSSFAPPTKRRSPNLPCAHLRNWKRTSSFLLIFAETTLESLSIINKRFLNKNNKNRYNKDGTYNLTIYRVLADVFSRCKNSDCSSRRSRSYSFCLKREIVGSSRQLGGCNFY